MTLWLCGFAPKGGKYEKDYCSVTQDRVIHKIEKNVAMPEKGLVGCFCLIQWSNTSTVNPLVSWSTVGAATRRCAQEQDKQGLRGLESEQHQRCWLWITKLSSYLSSGRSVQRSAASAASGFAGSVSRFSQQSASSWMLSVIIIVFVIVFYGSY